MAKRGQTLRQPTGEKSSSQAKGLSSRPGTERAGVWPDNSSPVSEEEGRRDKMTPIERIFLKEVGREMEPEERQILLGIQKTRRKSRAGPRNRLYSRNR
jgi:hypothetical protein